jgi:uncharacterized protein
MSDNISSFTITRSMRVLQDVRSRFAICTLSPRYEAAIDRIISRLEEFCVKHKLSSDHGYVHAMRVYTHARFAYALMSSVSARNVFRGLVASLLHDVDDAKLFETKDYANAREMLHDFEESDVNSIIRMVKLVSFSANGNNTEGIFYFELIPRYADRLEAIGDEGVERCLDYTLKKGRPLFTPNTPRFESVKEMLEETHARMLAYKSDSASFIDHFYDKLVHLNIQTDNAYINEVSQSRIEFTFEFALNFGKTGSVTEEEVRSRLR